MPIAATGYQMYTVYRTVVELKMTENVQRWPGMSLPPSFDDLVVVVGCPRRHCQHHVGDAK